MKVLQKETAATASKRLAGKVALVTGGSRGIGAEIALRLASEGASVAISYAKSADRANQVVSQISELEVQAAAYKADASSGEESQKLIDDVLKQFGKIDILVNNAGVFEGGTVNQITLDQYDRIFDVNVKGVIATTVAAVQKMSDGGRIINLSSTAAKATLAGFSVYSASKAAIDTLTRIWAQDLGARKITVNAVAPGPVESDMYNSFANAEVEKQMIAKTALGRIGKPDDIAAVVAFLASSDGGWVTGQTIEANGGINI
ncbi:MAG TPA: glucose 1-dehydrogenase [Candidatus Obscuribacterales bacterium]